MGGYELLEQIDQAEPCRPEVREEQLQIVRELARRARHDDVIRQALDQMLDGVKDQDAAAVFRAFYLQGETARTLSRRFFVGKRCIYKQLLRVCDQLRIMLFGVDALFDLS